MAKNVEIIIDGVRHKLVKTKDPTCKDCTLKRQCTRTGHTLCYSVIGNWNYVFNKVEE